MSGETAEDDFENVGIAMALVTVAGLATGLGAAVVFFPSIVKLASRRVLAGSLGFSGGVMVYVSFVEIFGKSMSAFEDAFGEGEEGKAYAYATLCFFAGVVVMMALNLVVTALLGGHAHGHRGSGDEQRVTSATRSGNEESNNEQIVQGPTCCDDDPVGRLEEIQKMGTQLEDRKADPSLSDNEEIDEVCKATDDENRRLVAMGMNTAFAIGLHNFPEGLATFVAALGDPRVGAVLATAIAIHNIPEGLCVALPIYYATGKRVNAFFWALLSGASEIVAALLGWAVLANIVTDTIYAVLFGIVAGMMVMITTKELLPTAHFYDPEDTVVTYSFIFGMVVMALSLVLFAI